MLGGGGGSKGDGWQLAGRVRIYRAELFKRVFCAANSTAFYAMDIRRPLGYGRGFVVWAWVPRSPYVKRRDLQSGRFVSGIDPFSARYAADGDEFGQRSSGRSPGQ